MIQAIPSKGSEMTDFEFEFSAQGDEWEYYISGGEWLKTQDDPSETYRLATIFWSLIIICCCGVPTGCCMMAGYQKRKMKAGGNQIMVDHATLVTDGNPNAVMAPIDPTNKSGGIYDNHTSGQELELESLEDNE